MDVGDHPPPLYKGGPKIRYLTDSWIPWYLKVKGPPSSQEVCLFYQGLENVDAVTMMTFITCITCQSSPMEALSKSPLLSIASNVRLFHCQ